MFHKIISLFDRIGEKVEKYKIAFAGTGIIGSGLAVNAMIAGNRVSLYDVVPVEKVRENIENIMCIMVELGAVEQKTANQLLSEVLITNNLEEAVRDADFVQECVPERVDLKKQTYRVIQEVNGNKTVISSATSAKFPTELQEGALYPEVILVGHPYNPSYLLPLIEVCGGTQTSQKAIQLAMDVYNAMRKVPVLCRKEEKGFIANKISWGVMDSAKQVVEQGICSVEDVDKAIMYGPGLRMAVTGQLLTMSLGVNGGYREYEKKYMGKESASPEYIALAEGIDEALERRSEEQGRTAKEVIVYRDRMIAEILKAQNMF